MKRMRPLIKVAFLQMLDQMQISGIFKFISFLIITKMD